MLPLLYIALGAVGALVVRATWELARPTVLVKDEWHCEVRGYGNHASLVIDGVQHPMSFQEAEELGKALIIASISERKRMGASQEWDA